LKTVNLSPLCVNLHYYTTTVLWPTGLCLGLPGWAGTRKVKPVWIYCSKRQWVAVASAEHMQICISSQTDNLASIPPFSFYRPDALPATKPAASKHIFTICLISQMS